MGREGRHLGGGNAQRRRDGGFPERRQHGGFGYKVLETGDKP
jgi:hypothetical protein